MAVLGAGALPELGALRCHFEEEDDRRILFLVGELDLATSETFGQALDFVQRTDALCVDLDECEFIDSTGLTMIVDAAREFRHASGELSVRGLRGEVLHMFTLTGLLLPGSAIHVADGKAANTERSGAS
jgi:anti-anti-sigma factor